MEPSGPSSDLWSLGVCIFMMASGGISPFKDMRNQTSDGNIFDYITKCEYKFPNSPNFTDEVKDLITKLLVVNPIDRLGAGLPGTSNDFDALK